MSTYTMYTECVSAFSAHKCHGTLTWCVRAFPAVGHANRSPGSPSGTAITPYPNFLMRFTHGVVSFDCVIRM